MTSLRTAKRRGLVEWQRDCKDWKRMYGGATIGPRAHNPQMLEQITRLGLYRDNCEVKVLQSLWERGEYGAYFKAVRIGRQACFILAGIHLAAQRRAVSK